MSTSLLSHVSGSQWVSDGPQTPAQHFFAAYAATVDSYGFMEGAGSRFYSKHVVFHNTNGAEYHGAAQMWTWMRALFGQFARLRHDFHNVWEVQQGDGSLMLFMQGIRNIWLPGNETDKPEMSAPMFWVSRIGAINDDVDDQTGRVEEKEGEGEKLRFKEVWLYWDTNLLAPFMTKDAIAFKTENVVEKEKQRVGVSA